LEQKKKNFPIPIEMEIDFMCYFISRWGRQRAGGESWEEKEEENGAEKIKTILCWIMLLG